MQKSCGFDNCWATLYGRLHSARALLGLCSGVARVCVSLSARLCVCVCVCECEWKLAPPPPPPMGSSRAAPDFIGEILSRVTGWLGGGCTTHGPPETGRKYYGGEKTRAQRGKVTLCSIFHLEEPFLTVV